MVKDFSIFLPHFIWEHFNIKYNKNFYSKIKTLKSKDEKLEYLYHHFLDTRFSIRRIRDPGLIYTCVQGMQQEFSDLNLRRVIMENFDPLFGDEIPTKIPINTINKLGLIDGTIDLEPRDFSSYFYRYKLSDDDLDDDERIIVEYLLTEISTDKYVTYSLLIDYEGTTGDLYEDFYLYKLQNFRYNNLKYNMVYGTPEGMPRAVTRLCIMEVIVRIIQIFKEIYQVSDEVLDILYPSFLEVSSVIMDTWFMKKTLEEKLAILNQSYTSSKVHISALSYIKSIESDEKRLEEVKEITNDLYFTRYLHILRRIITTLVNEQIVHSRMRFDLLILLIKVYIEERQLPKARRTIEYIKQRFKIKSGSYSELICKIMEIQFQYNSDNPPKNTEIEQVRKQIESNKHGRNDFIKLLIELSLLYRMSHSYRKELEVLDIAKERSISSLDELYTGRYMFLKDFVEYQMSKTEMDFHTQIAPYVQLSSMGRYAYHHFDFQQADYLLSWNNRLMMKLGLSIKKLNEKNLLYSIDQMYYGLTCVVYDKIEFALQAFINVYVNDDQIHHDALSFIFLCSLVLGKEVDEKIKKTLRKFDAGDCTELARFLVENSFEVDLPNFEVVDNFVLALIPSYFTNYTLSEYLHDVGSKLADLGILDTGIMYIEKSMSLAKDDNKKSVIMGNLASIYSNQNRQQEAIKWYEQSLALSDINRGDNIVNLAAAYAGLLDYVKAVELIEEAFDNKLSFQYRDRRAYELKYYKNMINERPIISLLPQKFGRVKTFIETAEHSFRQIMKNDDLKDMDLFSCILPYCKAIEYMLDQMILLPFITDLETQYPNLELPKIINKKSKAIVLKKVLKEYKLGNHISLALGQWIKIHELHNDDLHQLLIMFADTALQTTLAIERIHNFLSETLSGSLNLADIRNNISHTGALNYQTLSQIKQKVVGIYNEIVKLLFPV